MPPRTFAADIVGHSCFADIIILGAHLPEPEPGDVIAFLETGAYQESSASNQCAAAAGLGPGPRRRGRGRGRDPRRRVGPRRRARARPHRAEDAQPDLAVTDDVATWVVAGLRVVAAVAFTGFWLTWRREPHDEPWLPDGYVGEEVFVFPDVIVRVALVVSAVLLVLEEPFGASLALIAAGMLTFLGIVDLAYFAKHRMFALDRGGLMNAGIVVGVLFLAVILVVRYA